MRRARILLIFLALALPAGASDSRPVLSLVIDALGYSLENGETAIRLVGQHTYTQCLPGGARATAFF